MTRTIIILFAILIAVPALAGPPVTGSMRPGPTRPPIRTIPQSLDAISREIERPKTRPTDFPPATGGGGISGPLGRTCAEARERMRWSDLPCSPFHPER